MVSLLKFEKKSYGTQIISQRIMICISTFYCTGIRTSSFFFIFIITGTRSLSVFGHVGFNLNASFEKRVKGGKTT